MPRADRRGRYRKTSSNGPKAKNNIGPGRLISCWTAEHARSRAARCWLPRSCRCAWPARRPCPVRGQVAAGRAGRVELEALGSVQSGFTDEEEDEADEDDDDDDDGDVGEEDEDENQRQGYEFSVGYGVTDFWKPELALALEQRKGRDLKADAIEFENTFQVLPTDAYYVNAGLLVAFEASLRDDVQAVEVGPLLQLPIGRLTNTANAIFEQPFGDDRETATVGFEYGWQSVFDVAGGLGLGFEAFGEIEKIANDPPSLSEQEHRIGPVALFEAELGEWGEIGIELGFLFGLTDETPDNTFKFNLEYEWGPDGDDGEVPEDDDSDRCRRGGWARDTGQGDGRGELMH